MNYKSILAQAIKLIKAYMVSKRGQKRVASVASLFSGLTSQLDAGIAELEKAKVETYTRIDELIDQGEEQNADIVKAHRLLIKLREITD
jgi:hypothetical protein